ncbi:MAG: DUF4040 domain-containing protein [Phycisphaeraceae bacterium]|nr:MAG: DUF4040 domain-containing protein [Phycisphaeraceae bacterium]
MLIATLLIFGAALVGPVVHRLLGRFAAPVLALAPLAGFIYFLREAKRIFEGGSVFENWNWAPELGVMLGFRLDGLALLFALLVTGVGVLVVVYAGAYLKGHVHLGRFYSYLLGFMGSMLGLVLTDNVIALFVFWELTSITSYLLIGFDHQRKAARDSALQALLVTGIGGLALLAGLVLLGVLGMQASLDDPWSVSGLIEGLAGGAIDRDSGLVHGAVVLILLGALTKSAIFPFHFWLPGAMEAPTPVSAYLHSSTMVKAGIFLIARFQQGFSGMALWDTTLVVLGGITMVGTVFLASRQTYYKKLLAYSTTSSLGAMAMLLGLGANAAVGAMGYLFAHAMFKGALFLVAGNVDHGAHEKDTEKVGGLAGKMPLTFAAALLAAASMAGVAPMLGFAAKKLMKYGLHGSEWETILVVGVTAFSVMTAMVACMVGVLPFIGKLKGSAGEAHEVSPGLLFGPLVLAVLGVVAGVMPGWFAAPLIASAASSVAGAEKSVSIGLGSLMKADLSMALTVGAIVAGVVLFVVRALWRRATSPVEWLDVVGPARMYTRSVSGTLWLAWWQTRILQNGYLRHYVWTILGTTIALVGYGLYRSGIERIPLPIDQPFYFEIALVMFIMAGAIGASTIRTRLAVVSVLGIVGFAIAAVYVIFGAFDVAMTQFAIETLIVIILVLVVYHLPRFRSFSTPISRWMDVLLALGFGAMMTVLALLAADVTLSGPISDYFAENAAPVAYGRNVVNVILVDFRATDTFGEIVVLALAALGVMTLLRLRASNPNGGTEGDGGKGEGA